MNRIFRIVWNAALRQFVVASELARSLGRIGGSTLARPKGGAGLQRLSLGILLGLAGLPAAYAHTSSIGYSNPTPYELVFWYGTYHGADEISGFEGSFHLVGPDGMDETVPFTELANSKPVGLIDGETNFYSDGTSLVGYDPRASTNGSVINWQGVHYTDLKPGTYTFTYVPIANPSQTWAPIDNIILSSSVTVITADLVSTLPRIGPGDVVDETWPVAENPIIFDGGTLQPTTTTTLDQTVSVAGGGGTIDTGEGKDLTLTGDIDGRGLLTKTGDGTLVIEGTNTSVGGLAIDGGVVSVGSDSALGDASAGLSLDGGTLNTTGDIDNGRDIALGAGGGTFDTDTGTTLTNSGTISGDGGLTKEGDGTLVLSGDNSYSGGTTINDGTLQVSDDSNLGTGDITIGDGTLQGGDSFDSDKGVTLTDAHSTIDTQDNTVGLTGDIDGDGALNKGGSGTLVLGGDNSFDGGLNINEGTVQVSDDANLGTGTVTIGDGILQAGGSFDSDNAIALTNADSSIDTQGNTVGLTGDIDGEGALNKSGSGTLVLGGDNSFDGGLNIDEGTVQVSGDANLGTGTVTIGDGTLQAGGDFGSDNAIVITGDASTVNTQDHEVSLTGAIGGDGTLVKDGSGTLDLEGVLSHTGGTVVNDGTLVLGGDNTYTGGTTINDGGALQIGSDTNLGAAEGGLAFDGGTLHTTGDVTSDRDINLVGDGTIDTDAGTTMTNAGDVGGDGTLIKDGEGTLDLEGVLSHSGGTVVNDGTLVLGGENTYTGGTTINDGGTLQIGSDTNLGAAEGGLTFDGGTLHTTGDVTSDRDISLVGDGTIDTDAGTTMTNAGDVGGDGTLIKDGEGTLDLEGVLSHSGGTVVNDGTLVLGGDNTYTGGTTINDGGALQIGSDTNLGAAEGGLAFDGGTLHTTGDVTSDRDINLVGDGTIDTDAGTTMTNAGDVGGDGTLIKDGEGTLDLEGVLSHSGGTVVNDGTLVLGGDNTYTGGTTLNGGTLQIGSDANLGATSGGLTFDGGTLHTTDSFSTGRQVTLAGEGGFDVDTGTTLTATGAIDGSGHLVKQGEGTLVLTGANSYTGGTTIEAGTLQGDSSSLHGDIVDNGTLDFVQAGNGSFGGTISGTGVLVKDGKGTLTLSGVASHQGGTVVNDGKLVLTGSNTYTGGTTVNGGELQVGRDANLGAASSGLALNGGTLHTTGSFSSGRDIALGGGSVVTDAGTTFTSNGALGGTGGLVKNGQGTMVVGGNASHHGGTTVNAGTLVLKGDNSYTGGTTLNGGSLQVSRDANLGNAADPIVFNGGDLTVTQSMASGRDLLINKGNASITTLDGVTFTAQGDMSGSGGLVKRGGGTLVVSGTNTFTGGTLIDGGVIKIDSGSSLGTGTILLHGGTLQTVETLGTGQTVLVSGDSGVNVDTGKTAELSGQILTDGNAGCFIKSGKGTLNMTGTATLSNGTCVQDGMLRANGELTSQVQVDRPGTLRGVGLVKGSVNVEGTLAPGNSPGTMAVAGDVTMHEGSTLQIDIDGLGTAAGKGNYSRLLVGGSFVAAGTLAPTLRGITGDASNTFTPEVGDVYTVVEAAGGVKGTFDALRQPTAGLADNTRFQVFYLGGKAIQLFVTPASYAGLLAGKANGNAVRLGSAVDRVVAAQDAGSVDAAQRDLLFTLAGMRAAQLPQVMQDLAGETHVQVAAMAREAGLGLAGDIAQHLAESPLDQGGHGDRAWATLSQGGYRALSDAQATGFQSQQSRASVGLDAYRGDAVQWGVGLAHTEAHLAKVPASGSVRGNGALLYGELAAGPALFDGSVSWSKDRWSTRRADPFAPASSLSAQADGHSTAASVTARFPLQHRGLHVEPYAQALWQRVDRGGLTETGDALTRLTMGRYEASGTRVLAGINLGSAAQDPLAATTTWRVGAAVGRDFGDVLDPVVNASLDGASFQLQSPAMGRTLLKLDASGTLRLGQQAWLYGGLNSATADNRSSYGVNVGVRVQF